MTNEDIASRIAGIKAVQCDDEDAHAAEDKLLHGYPELRQ